MKSKIINSTSEIINLYTNEDMTFREIAAKFGCDKKAIGRLLKRNNIEIKRFKREYSFYYNQKLTDIQKQLIEGSLLGDGGVYKHHEGINSCRFSEAHCVAQLDYLKWKISILSNFISNDIRMIDNTKTNSFGTEPTYEFQTVLHSEFTEFRNRFYPDGKKIVPYFKLTPLSVAAWFFDDGSICKNGSSSYCATFHTQGFNSTDIDCLRTMLSDSFGIDTYIINTTKGESNYQIIRLNNKEYSKLCEIIKPSTIPCMSYKNILFNNPVETCSIKEQSFESEMIQG